MDVNFNLIKFNLKGELVESNGTEETYVQLKKNSTDVGSKKPKKYIEEDLYAFNAIIQLLKTCANSEILLRQSINQFANFADVQQCSKSP